MIERRPITFFSDGLRLDGDVYLPPDLRPGERRPAVIPLSGYQGLKGLQPARFARALVPLGYVCLAFDYRGFGRSEGQRGRLVPQVQCEDARAAISFLETVPEVDPGKISLIGWALGGGVAIVTAADDPRLRCVVALNAIGDGERSVRFMHDEASFQELLDRIRADRRRRGLEGKSELLHPFDIVRLDSATKVYVDAELYPEPGFGSEVSVESADLLFRFRPADVVERIAPRPLLLFHGQDNRLHSVDESHDLYSHAHEPKRLVVLERSGHTDWMFDDHPTFRQVVQLTHEFIAGAVAVTPTQ
ncbi:MAG TPA: alpha/beta hydrolase [Candidatus Dormibacteraeota bacterium]|nr:alpha/beta hydrolase [Candidatus Dormibacteraeota bacterium]